MTVHANQPAVAPTNDPAALRQDLAAAFRLCHRFGWSESVGNHFSAALSADGRTFLLNRCWQHFSTIRPSDLLVVDLDATGPAEETQTVDPSALAVHGALHREVPEARVVLHCHSPYATALACLTDPTLLPIDNNTARFFGRIGYDLEFGGISDNEAEGAHLASAMRGNTVLMMANHGVTVIGDTVAEAFEDLYFFEKAARTQILAQSTGQPLSILSNEVARNTADGWQTYRGMGERHFEHLKRQLDAEEPAWRL